MPKATLNPFVQIDLTAKVEREYRFGGCNRLWLPKQLSTNLKDIVFNPQDAVIAVRINDRSGQAHLWAIIDGYVNQTSGEMESIWVTVVQKGASDTMYLGTGNDIGIGHCSADGLSPQVAGPGTSSLQQTRNIGGGGGS